MTWLKLKVSENLKAEILKMIIGFQLLLRLIHGKILIPHCLHTKVHCKCLYIARINMFLVQLLTAQHINGCDIFHLVVLTLIYRYGQ